MTDKELIEQGMILKRLVESDDFSIFQAEIYERIARYSDLVLNFRPGARVTDIGIEYYLYRLQGFKELMLWLEDEIVTGERALLKQRAEQSKKVFA